MRYRVSLLLLFVLSILGIPIISAVEQSSPVFSLTEETEGTSLSYGMAYLLDPDEIYTTALLSDPGSSFLFKRNNTQSMDFGLSSGAVWLMFTADNPTEFSEWVLQFDIHKFYTAALFQNKDNGKFEQVGIYNYKDSFTEKPIQEALLAFPLRILPGERVRFLLKVKSENGLTLPLILFEKSRYEQKTTDLKLRWTILYTVMIIMILYNLIIFIFLKDPNYLYYFIYVSVYMFYLAALSGMGSQFIWPTVEGRWTTVFSPCLGGLSLAVGILLTKEFLQIKNLPRFINLYFKTLIALSLILAAFNFIVEPFHIAYILGNTLGTLILFSILGVSIFTLTRGYKPAIFFITSYFMIIIGQLIYSLKALGYFKGFPALQNANQITPVIQVILLSLSLAYRIKINQEEKDMAQAETLQAEQMLKEKLEEKVNERTRELQMANQKLVLLSNIDSLTGLFNRRYFDENLQIEWKRHQRSELALSLLICDIDYFKKFNDTAGHQEGDECLRLVAEAIKKGTKREMDIPARYGGEEFAVILPLCDETGALQIAEKIAENVKALGIIHPAYEDNRRLSLSIGIMTVIPLYGMDPKILVGGADKAMYFSKQHGRNRITMEKDLPQ